MSRKHKSASPYTKYSKGPYIYSDLYRRWRSAVTGGRTAEARELGHKHQQQFGPFPEPRGSLDYHRGRTHRQWRPSSYDESQAA